LRSIAVFLIVAAGCAPPPNQSPVATAGIEIRSCATEGADSDEDGLIDECEFDLARRFAPLLNASAEACNVVGRAESRRIGGGYLHAVAPDSQGGARIAYLPAYFRDCGWEGVKCSIPGIDCAPHTGDSEILVVDVRRASGSDWSITGVFLSAHCFGKSDASCRWYRGPQLKQFNPGSGPTQGPTVWVSNGRNANYPTRRACDEGHWLIDTCSGERFSFVFPVQRHANLGSRSVPLLERGCTVARTVDPSGENTAAGAVECFWTDDSRFRGWQNSGVGVTPYSRYLGVIAGW
jgi:hypothetical protein